MSSIFSFTHHSYTKTILGSVSCLRTHWDMLMETGIELLLVSWQAFLPPEPQPHGFCVCMCLCACVCALGNQTSGAGLFLSIHAHSTLFTAPLTAIKKHAWVCLCMCLYVCVYNHQALPAFSSSHFPPLCFSRAKGFIAWEKCDPEVNAQYFWKYNIVRSPPTTTTYKCLKITYVLIWFYTHNILIEK